MLKPPPLQIFLSGSFQGSAMQSVKNESYKGQYLVKMPAKECFTSRKQFCFCDRNSMSYPPVSQELPSPFILNPPINCSSRAPEEPSKEEIHQEGIIPCVRNSSVPHLHADSHHQSCLWAPQDGTAATWGSLPWIRELFSSSCP